MKRKGLILLSSILAGSLLVGGAFAAYAVTDNADPFGFVTTPGTYEEDDTKYVTMSFGDKVGFDNIENLEVGKHYRAGVVSLKATQKYEGDFTITLTDRTVREEAATYKLIDYLDVGVYEGAQSGVAEGNLPDAQYLRGSVGIGKGEQGANTTTLSVPLVGVAAGKEYAVYLTLDASAKNYYSLMSEDKVYVEIDWNPKSGDESTAYNVYFDRASVSEQWGAIDEDTEVYLYAFGDTEGEDNAKWPGVKMTHLRSSIYTLAVPNSYMNLVFNAGDNNDEHKTTDLLMTETLLNNGYTFYQAGEWKELPPEQVLPSAYSVSIAGAEAQSMTKKTTTDTTDGRLAEYMLLDQEIEANATLAFSADEAAITENITFEGNANAQGKVVTAGDDIDIYLKVYEGTGADSGKLFYVVYVSDAAEEETGLLFSNNKAWGDVHIYAWAGEGDNVVKKTGEWPGVALVKVGENEYGEELFALNIQEDWEHFIINGSGGQTVDIDVADLAGKDGIYLLDTQDAQGHYNYGSYINK